MKVLIIASEREKEHQVMRKREYEEGDVLDSFLDLWGSVRSLIRSFVGWVARPDGTVIAGSALGAVASRPSPAPRINLRIFFASFSALPILFSSCADHSIPAWSRRFVYNIITIK